MLRIVGITDDVTKCDCCGRSNLKRTVALTDVEGFPHPEDVKFYGSQCAATALRFAGIKGFKNHVTTAAVNKIAYQAQQTTDNNAQNDLMRDGLVNWNKGKFALPGQEDQPASIRVKNLIEAYPCFASAYGGR